MICGLEVAGLILTERKVAQASRLQYLRRQAGRLRYLDETSIPQPLNALRTWQGSREGALLAKWTHYPR
jgi:hypothetical protein